MADVTVSIATELLAHIDAEARRQNLSRSGLLQKAARREIGPGSGNRNEIIARLEEISKEFQGPFDAAAEIRRDRER